jgi:serine/threonine protein kinase
MVERAAAVSTLYELTAELGRGGYSRVLAARRLSSDERVACKTVEKDERWQRSADMLDDEIRIWRKCSSPLVVQLHSVYDTPTHTFIFCELCAGGCLVDAIEEVDGFNEEMASAIASQIVDAIVYLHSINVCHRDIKPDNVLCIDRKLDLYGHVKLADLGYSTDFHGGGAHGGGAGGGGVRLKRLLGTPEYLAPEMIRCMREWREQGQHDGYDQSIDFWSLGVLIYELLAGLPPFFSEDDDEQMEMTLTAELVFPEQMFDNVSVEAQNLISWLLQRDPERRPTAEELASHPWLVRVGAQSVLGAWLERETSAMLAGDEDERDGNPSDPASPPRPHDRTMNRSSRNSHSERNSHDSFSSAHSGDSFSFDATLGKLVGSPEKSLNGRAERAAGFRKHRRRQREGYLSMLGRAFTRVNLGLDTIQENGAMFMRRLSFPSPTMGRGSFGSGRSPGSERFSWFKSSGRLSSGDQSPAPSPRNEPADTPVSCGRTHPSSPTSDDTPK